MDEAWRLEEEFWRASAEGRVDDHYSRVLATDGFVVTPDGVFDREALLVAWEAAAPWREWSLSEQRIVLVNGETVVLTYRVRASSATLPDYRARVSSVYTWVGRWVLALRQHSPEPGMDAPAG